ncbi:MAG: hypothetical protein MJ246_01390 [Clostridia bacterium]|nr:hypothetical protein [Clostridia bacterium]
MKKTIVYLAFVIMFVFVFTGCEKKENDALNVYREILKSSPAIEGEHEELSDASFSYEQNNEKFGDHIDEFALYDINQDGTPELITLSIVNFRWTPISIYTIIDDKAVLVKDPSYENAHGTFEDCSTANGAYLVYVCEDGHIHNVWRGTNPIGEEVEENNSYVLVDGRLESTTCDNKENIIYFSDITKPNTTKNISALKDLYE